MKTILMADPQRYPRMTTEELREAFLFSGMNQPGSIALNYLDLDRAVVGMAVPSHDSITLSAPSELRAKYFTERRELGALNVGGAGVVHVNGVAHQLDHLDLVYIGRGNPDIRFASDDPAQPAGFYLLSYPAHATHPVTVVRGNMAEATELGSAESCNRRTVYKYVHTGGVKSCQLVMGVTHLHSGSAWNTMPPHTHMRRSEIYLYFDLPEDARVFHLMGPPDQTRHIVIENREAVASPGWSIHAGVGTRAYKFCWGMGGENQDYADMDPAPISTLR